MTVAVIDYGSGNLRSMAKSLERAASTTGQSIIITSDPHTISEATHIVLPGVGAFGDCMQGLQQLPGMIDTLEEAVLHQKKPFLGVCVGMQLLATQGLEHGMHQGLGWIPGKVVPITTTNPSLKIPHMGWNELKPVKNHSILNGILIHSHAYFVHSFHFIPEDKADVLLSVDYGVPLVAAMARDNIIATQFHPEKSQQTGLRLLTNFLSMEH